MVTVGHGGDQTTRMTDELDVLAPAEHRHINMDSRTDGVIIQSVAKDVMSPQCRGPTTRLRSVPSRANPLAGLSRLSVGLSGWRAYLDVIREAA
jgi:hypothetical protein